MRSSGIRPTHLALGFGALLAYAVGLPTKAQGAVCHAYFAIFQHGSCSTTTSQGCFEDSDCPGGENCFVPFLVPGDPVRGRNRIRVDVGGGPITVSPPRVTVNRFRFALDCVANSGFPCTDQGDVVEYLGDATITTSCGVTWTSDQPMGGVGGNEIVFTPSTPLVIDQNCVPGDTSCGGCSVAFDLQVANPEPMAGSCSITTSLACGATGFGINDCPAGETCVGAQANSDSSPQVVEEVAGGINGAGDATCSATLQSGSSQTDDLLICPTCTGDACECDVTTGQCVPPQPGASCPSPTSTTITTTTTSTSTTLQNHPPDCSGAVASPNELSPPNHRFVGVSVGGVTDPDGDAVTLTITSISQDEPLRGAATGNTCPDASGVGTAMASLRAERSGSGDGRVYHVSFTADDGKGGACSASVAVCVPVERRAGQGCVDQGALVDSTSCP